MADALGMLLVEAVSEALCELEVRKHFITKHVYTHKEFDLAIVKCHDNLLAKEVM